MESTKSEVWLADFRKIILNYMNHRTSDPFMEWFQRREKAGVFADDEKVLSTIIAARFDQYTTAESAFRNTQTVIGCGALKKTIGRKELPVLIPKNQKTAEDWTQLFCDALPKLHILAKKIIEKNEWKADDLLSVFSDKRWKVPYLGTKTSRLAVRWLHEQVPAITIDMRTYKIPIDKLVYRVSSRLGIIDPYNDQYFGNDSPADIKIQSFVKKVFPESPWMMDEPLWSVGRISSKGGHCYPSNTNCCNCMFEKLCAKKFRDVTPEKIGMLTASGKRQSSCSCAMVRNSNTENQTAFASYIDELKKQGITTGERFRELRDQWLRQHRKPESEET